MRRSFTHLTYSPKGEAVTSPSEPYMTAEQIEVAANYHPRDVASLSHLNFSAGIAPFLRGPYGSMYVTQPWTIRQYAGFSNATFIVEKIFYFSACI